MILKAENILIRLALLLSGAAMAASCTGLVFEQEGNCDDDVEVYLKYDYNVQRADMRPFHVGWAEVYAIDQNGKVAATATVSPQEAADKNSTVKFGGLQPGHYTFMAIAMQRPYEQLAAESGARFRANLPVVGSEASSLEVRLDRKNEGGEFSKVNAPACGLDTLWIGHSFKGGITMPEVNSQTGTTHRDTISLVRDTKYLHLTLHQTENRPDIHDTDYEVRVIDANGHLGWDNNLIKDETIEYTPFASWTTELTEDDTVIERAAHFNISFSRLMYNAAGKPNATLEIFSKATNKTVARVDLAYYLAFGRDAFAMRNYTPQEYLDRQYDYRMDFFLNDRTWEKLEISVGLSINVLPWAIRFQNEIF